MINIILNNEPSSYYLDPKNLEVYGKRGKLTPILWGHLDSTKIMKARHMYSFNHNGVKIRVLRHRLLAHYLIKPLEDGDTVNHLDGDHLNNELYNLEIVSMRDNIIHAFQTGLSNGNCYRAVLLEKNGVFTPYESIYQCSKETGLNSGNLHSAIKHGHLLKGYKVSEILRDSPILKEI